MFKESLVEGAKRLGLAVSSEIFEKFEKYFHLLCDKNKEVNLTAVTEDDFLERHFLDSLSCLTVMDFSGLSVIDVGSGAGFPGVPIALCGGVSGVTLLDSQIKRVNFLRELSVELSLDAEVLHGRAEETAKNHLYRDSFDVALSRALARLDILIELCLPFVRIGGTFIAMKSENANAEAELSKNAVEKLGGYIDGIFGYEIGGVKRQLIVVKKKNPTPEGFPRSYKKISTRPL